MGIEPVWVLGRAKPQAVGAPGLIVPAVLVPSVARLVLEGREAEVELMVEEGLDVPLSWLSVLSPCPVPA